MGSRLDHPYAFTEPDDALWKQYDELATRCFGHRVGDITSLREQATARVATRDGRVVAGGLGLAVKQFFGGKAVPSACLGAGCVAPEERGHRLADLLMTERVQALRDCGAVVATLWTSSNAYLRRLGWQAPVPVFGWSLAAEDLRTFTADSYQVELGLTPSARALQRCLAADWNGPVLRPDWWWSWKEARSDLITYRFSRPGRPTEGVLSVTTAPRKPRGMELIVHDLWAANTTAAAAIYAFLGQHHSRVETVHFRRGALPPCLTLLHGLHRYRLSAEAWHPWMLRVLDIPQALRRRGWPADLSFATAIEVGGDAHDEPRRYLLRVSDGAADVDVVDVEPVVRFSRGQLAVWYAGGYTTATTARLGGVHGDSADALATLVRATHHLDPWLPDLF